MTVGSHTVSQARQRLLVGTMVSRGRTDTRRFFDSQHGAGMKRKIKRLSPFTKSQRDSYRESHKFCEYSLAVGRDFDFFAWSGNDVIRRRATAPRANELDHIWGRNGKEEDAEHPSNYMAACSAAHQWKTENDVAGRIIALYWKWLHRDTDPEGWELDRVHRLFGKIPLGWLENTLESMELPTWVQVRGYELLG